MNEPTLLLLTESVGPFPGHTEMTVIGHFNVDSPDRLRDAAAKITESMKYLGGIRRPVNLGERVKVICEELVKRGFAPIDVKRVTISGD